MVADGFEAARLDESGSWLGELATRLVARGHRVNALCVRPVEPWQEPHDPSGVAVWRPAEGAMDSALKQALELRPDVVHLATSHAWSDVALQMLVDAPLLLDAHGFWPVCANGDLIQRPRFIACSNHHPHVDCGACAGLSRMRAMEPRMLLAARARRVLAHSRWARERISRGLQREVDLVPFGVDPQRFSPRPQAPLAPEVAALFADRSTPRVLLLGPPLFTRGIARATDLLVALNARVPGVQLVVAGRDPENPEAPQILLGEARALGLADQVKLLPAVLPMDLPALIASCTVACAPGTIADWGGLFMLQALAAGVPVVAHPGGVAPELITHRREGLLAPIRDLPAFAEAVASLLRDAEVRKAYSERARLAAIERFDGERTQFAIEELYHEVRDGGAREAAGGPEYPPAWPTRRVA